jgi:hypothetical protein
MPKEVLAAGTAETMSSRTNHDYFAFCFSYLGRRLSPFHPERASKLGLTAGVLAVATETSAHWCFGTQVGRADVSGWRTLPMVLLVLLIICSLDGMIVTRSGISNNLS